VTSQPTRQIQVNKPLHVAEVNNVFLAELVAELDNEQVTGIVLKGSCARHEETIYSDVDLSVFVREEAKQKQHVYFYREGRLISIGTHTIEAYLRRFLLPEEAIFVVPSIREARILLDKEDVCKRLQEEAWQWRWEPLQEAANHYAYEMLLEQTEIVLKALRAFLLQDTLALTEMTLILFQAMTDALAVQRGILAQSGNSYFRQVQACAGLNSAWTQYHSLIADVERLPNMPSPVESKGIAALRLFQETTRLLSSAITGYEHSQTIAQTVTLIEEALAGKQLP
jgi:predicted nucleotidyltransferase